MDEHPNTAVSSRLASRPQPADVARLGAIIAHIHQNPTQALALVQGFITDFPAFAPAHRVAALAARVAGETTAAAAFDTSAIAASAARPAIAAAAQAMAAGRLDEAEPLLRRHLREEDPEDPLAAHMLGSLAAGCGALPEAERLHGRALKIAPGYVAAGLALAGLQRDGGHYAKALDTLNALLAHAPDDVEAALFKADLLLQERRLDEAQTTLAALTQAHANDPRTHLKYAHLLKTLGARDQAIAAYRRALALAPASGQAWWALANLRTVRLNARDIAAITDALDQPDIAPDERINLYYALGKAHEDAGEAAPAFAAYAAGAAGRLARVPHDPALVAADIARNQTLFTREFFATRQGWGCPSAAPVFIVSLPRSGSTLVEQILASHSAIEGTEELHDIERIALEIGGGPHGVPWTSRIASLSPADIRAAGEMYIAATRRHRHTDRPFFTDKMPSNWVYTGLIRLILPNARIIDVRRHPLACGWANFTQHFSWGIDYSYDLAHIGRFYAAYVRQMAHFDSVAPGLITRIHHEALVADLEGSVRAVLAGLGLDFDPACLRFFETARPIHTPSADQVRRPVNADGLDRWRAYEPWLEPMKGALGPVLAAYPHVPSMA